MMNHRKELEEITELARNGDLKAAQKLLNILAEETQPKVDYWSSDPQFPVETWQWEVSEDATRMGYWDWVDYKRESEPDDTE